MKIATLLYIQNSKGEFLLLERLKEPNKGLMSPPGGKLDTEAAESPAACSVREAFEECSMNTNEEDWKLAGVITEKNYPTVGNIMIFLMKYKNFLNELPPECNEGAFHFVKYEELSNHKIPVTDKLFLWEYIVKKNDEPFILTLDCSEYPDIKKLDVRR